MTPPWSVVAGNLFHPEPTSDLVRFVDATLAALPALCEKIAAFTTNPRHRFIVLPGSEDHELKFNQDARGRLEQLGVAFASDLILTWPRPMAYATWRSPRARAPSTRRAPTSTIAPTRIVSKTRTHCRASSPLACCTATGRLGLVPGDRVVVV